MAQGYQIFHLNLAFSSIASESRPEVISKCYWPLLELVESTGIPAGIELTGWTLQQINMLDKSWVDRFRQMLGSGKCELIGSGWSQLIGPLVPYDVNRWNQKLGLEFYREVLGVTPKIALVNEMAFSSGMVAVYIDAGYEAIVMDRDNVRLALDLDHDPILATPTHARGARDMSMPVLWSDSILFQRLQRVAHGDIPVTEYLDYVRKRADQDNTVLPIYCNDVEIFDYRPGRFTAESQLHPEGEWLRLRNICDRLQLELNMDWLSPSQALVVSQGESSPNIQNLTSIRQPVPVKKQAKYNINRWAVTGRDDLWLNTCCHRIYQAFVRQDVVSEDYWRELCEVWASDIRTHITDKRWQKAVKKVTVLCDQFDLGLGESERSDLTDLSDSPDDIESLDGVEISKDGEGIFWTIKTDLVHIVLNARRGLTIHSLAFKSHDFRPVIGTLSQGYFQSIELGADFYSGGVIIEIPGERIRVTDLEWVDPEIRVHESKILITASILLKERRIEKVVAIGLNSEILGLSYNFPDWKRPLGIVRVGMITLFPEWYASRIRIGCHNGGEEEEKFELDQAVNHGRAASSLVSSMAAFGATNGRVVIENAKKNGISVSWNPADCAAVPMLHHQLSRERYLTRLMFSLCELDDTSRVGGNLMSFKFEVAPLQ